METGSSVMQSSLEYLVIRTEVDQLVVDLNLHKYVRVPYSTEITELGLGHHKWLDYAKFTTGYIAGQKRFSIWTNERHRITGRILETTKVHI